MKNAGQCIQFDNTNDVHSIAILVFLVILLALTGALIMTLYYIYLSIHSAIFLDFHSVH